MEVSFDPTELKKCLAVNIGMMGRALISRGYDLKILDKSAQECRDYVSDRAGRLEPKDEVDRTSMESLFIMIMMHTQLKSQEAYIEAMAREKGVDINTVINELVIQTVGPTIEAMMEKGKKIKVE